MRQGISLFVVGLLVTFLVPKAFADGPSGVGYGVNTCQTIYGGGTNCVTSEMINVNKLVQNPSTNQFVDNLGINDPRFSPSSTVAFQIIVTNTGNKDFDKVTVNDTFPGLVTFTSGPGSFDTNAKKLTFDVMNLKAGESRTYTITGTTAKFEDMPAGQGVSCVVNNVRVTSGNQSSEDNAGLCIEKKQATGQPQTKGGLKVFPSVPVSSTPSTGPELLGLLALIPSAVSGWFLRMKSKVVKKAR